MNIPQKAELELLRAKIKGLNTEIRAVKKLRKTADVGWNRYFSNFHSHKLQELKENLRRHHVAVAMLRGRKPWEVESPNTHKAIAKHKVMVVLKNHLRVELSPGNYSYGDDIKRRAEKRKSVLDAYTEDLNAWWRVCYARDMARSGTLSPNWQKVIDEWDPTPVKEAA